MITNEAFDALARALARYRQTVIDTDQVKLGDHVQAERILADPAPLLAALAEAGVLTEEWAVRRVCGCFSPEGSILACCLPGGLSDADRPLSRYVSDWTEVPREGDD